MIKTKKRLPAPPIEFPSMISDSGESISPIARTSEKAKGAGFGYMLIVYPEYIIELHKEFIKKTYY
jgi:hypothetical protein